jgi:hypothetical protein
MNNDVLLDRTPPTPRQPYTPVVKRRNSDPSLSSNVDFDMYLRNDDNNDENNGDSIRDGSGITAATDSSTRADGIKLSDPKGEQMSPSQASLTPSNVFSSTGGPDLVDIEKLIGKLSLQPGQPFRSLLAGTSYLHHVHNAIFRRRLGRLLAAIDGTPTFSSV